MARTSSEKRNTFQKILRAAFAETRAQKKLLIITLVLYGAAFLLFALNADYRWTGSGSDVTFDFQPSGVGAVFAVFGALVGFFAVLNVFRDMSSPQLCDVSLSLPLRARERFLARLLSLFFLQVAPLLFSTVCGNALAALFGSFSYGVVPVLSEMPFFLFPLLFLTGSLFILSVTTLCACCCGSMAESAYFSLIFMFIVNVLPQSFLSHVFEDCAGYRTGFVLYPAEGFDFCRYWGFLYLFGEAEQMIRYCIVGSLISVAVMLLSGLIYARRDARTVGTPIVSRIFFEIFLFLGCATVFSFFSFGPETPWGVLIAAVIYMIINIIVTRARLGVRSVLLWCGKYLATAAVCFAVLTAASVTGGFGAIALRPEARYLEGASVRISCNNFELTLVADRLTAEQADQIMEICKRHMIEGRKEAGAALVWGRLAERYIPDARTAYFSVSLSSEETYPERPSPRFQFDEHYVYTEIPAGTDPFGNGGYLSSGGGYAYLPDGSYSLNFDQDVLVSRAASEAAAKELLALDFVRVQEPDGEITAYDAETGEPYYEELP